MTNKEALIALNAVKELSNRRILKLLKVFGSANAVWQADTESLQNRGGLKPQAVAAMQAFPREKFLEKEFFYINNNIIISTLYDNDYPEPLRHISDAPVVLYIDGQLPSDWSLATALVGSRQASLYGRTTAQKVAHRLAEYGIPIVSGLAKGIDTAAHRGCLQAGGRTIAVLGCGLNNPYPIENRQLRDQICRHGAVISEFPMDTPPRPYHFPRRNRIVSGLSRAVIVIEAATKSGALITADFALEQGKDVFAVPAMIDQANAAGAHQLIREGAQLMSCVEDVLTDYELLVFPVQSKPQSCPSPLPQDLSEAEGQLIKHITDRPVHIDELMQSGGLDLVTTTRVLLSLELKQLITQLPGKRFKR